MLTPMVERLRHNRTFEGAIRTILDDAVALHGAEYGNVQLPVGDELVIAAQRNFQPPFLKAFERVKVADGCACGRALKLRQPIVIGDVDKDPEFAAFRKDAKTAGFRSVQSTPFIAKDGSVLAVVSTHFAAVHEPSQIEMRMLEQYGVLAAAYLQDLLGDVPLAVRAAHMSDALYQRPAEHEKSLPCAGEANRASVESLTS